MKRKVLVLTSIAAVLALAWVSLAQPDEARTEQRRARMRQWRESQIEAMTQMQETLEIMKQNLLDVPEPERDINWQELSDEEKEQMRDRFREMRKYRNENLRDLGKNLAKLHGPAKIRKKQREVAGKLIRGYRGYIGRLKGIQQIAEEEGATETAQAIEDFLKNKNSQIRDKMREHGWRGRGRWGGSRGPEPEEEGETND